MSVITAAVRDSSVIAHRNLLNVLRTPGALVTGIVQPVMFVLLLGFVFGGSLGGDQYRSFLIGGILAQTLTFNASFTAVYLAKDLQLGLIDRFRSLPMSRVACHSGAHHLGSFHQRHFRSGDAALRLGSWLADEHRSS